MSWPISRRAAAGALGALAAVGMLAACATSLPPAPDPSLEAGRGLYAAKCQGCHRPYPPSKIDRAKWPSFLDRMAVKAKVTPAEKSQIDAYVRACIPPAGSK